MPPNKWWANFEMYCNYSICVNSPLDLYNENLFLIKVCRRSKNCGEIRNELYKLVGDDQKVLHCSVAYHKYINMQVLYRFEQSNNCNPLGILPFYLHLYLLLWVNIAWQSIYHGVNILFLFDCQLFYYSSIFNLASGILQLSILGQA